jgi:ABC-2 type transport system ATP-binding protein
MQLTLMQILREAVAEGRTVLFSSHSLNEVESLCNHVLMIRHGQMVVDESLKSLQSKAPRLVCLTVQAGVELDFSDLPKKNVLSIQKREAHLEVLIEGPAKEIVNWSSRHPIEDISISPPSLDKLFRQYYRDDDSSSIDL